MPTQKELEDNILIALNTWINKKFSESSENALLESLYQLSASMDPTIMNDMNAREKGTLSILNAVAHTLNDTLINANINDMDIRRIFQRLEDITHQFNEQIEQLSNDPDFGDETTAHGKEITLETAKLGIHSSNIEYLITAFKKNLSVSSQELQVIENDLQAQNRINQQIRQQSLKTPEQINKQINKDTSKKMTPELKANIQYINIVEQLEKINKLFLESAVQERKILSIEHNKKIRVAVKTRLDQISEALSTLPPENLALNAQLQQQLDNLRGIQARIKAIAPTPIFSLQTVKNVIEKIKKIPKKIKALMTANIVVVPSVPSVPPAIAGSDTLGIAFDLSTSPQEAGTGLTHTRLESTELNKAETFAKTNKSAFEAFKKTPVREEDGENSSESFHQ